MTLTEFLTARLDEDAAVAKAAADDRWGEDSPAYTPEWTYEDDGEVEPYVTVDHEGLSPAVEPRVGRHIARHDPARVLAEVEAKRRIVDLAQRNTNAPWDAYAIGRDDLGRHALRLLALPYADHPDYDEAWRP